MPSASHRRSIPRPQGPTHAASPFSVTPSFFQSPRLWNMPCSLQPHGFQPCERLCLYRLQLLARLMPFPLASLRLPPGQRKHPGSSMRDNVMELPARGCESKRQHGDDEVLWASVTQGGHLPWGWRNTGSLEGVLELGPRHLRRGRSAWGPQLEHQHPGEGPDSRHPCP